MIVFFIYCKLKTNFIAKSQLLYVGCPLKRESKQKKYPIFISKSVRSRESVRLRECVNTEFDWEIRRGIEKVSVSGAVRLRESPLAESRLPSRLLSKFMPTFKVLTKSPSGEAAGTI